MDCDKKANSPHPDERNNFPILRLPICTCGECTMEGDAGPTVKRIKGHGAWNDVRVVACGRVYLRVLVQTEYI